MQIEITKDELATVKRALSIAYILYTNRKKLPHVGKWRPSERAMAAAEVSMLFDRLAAMDAQPKKEGL